MTASFAAGFVCCGTVVFLYLFHEAIGILRELTELLRENLQELRDE